MINSTDAGTRRAGAALLLSAILILSWAHVYLVSRPDTAGLLLVLDHLFNVVIVATLLLICMAAGLRVLEVIGYRPSSPTERLATAVGTGSGIVATALLLLGAVGALRPHWIAVLLAMVAGACWRVLPDCTDLARDTSREVLRRATLGWLGAVVVVFAGMLVLAVAPPTDYDSLMYHLVVPEQFLATGRVHVPDGNLHVSFVGLVHLLYVPLLAAGAPAACAVLNVMFGLLLTLVVLVAGHNLFHAAAGKIAHITLWASPILLLAAITPKVDIVLTYYVFLAHYVLVAPHDGERSEYLPSVSAAAILLGLAIGTKHLALLYIAALVPVGLFELRRRCPPGGRLRGALLFGGVLSAVAAPWLLKNWILLGAPFYPQLAEPILPSWLARMYGSISIPPVSPEWTLHPLGAVRSPFSIVDWFLAPERMTPEAEGVAYRANLIFLGLPFAALLLRDRRLVAVLLPGMLFLGAVLLYNTSLNLRYMIPALPSLTLTSAAVVGEVAVRARRDWLRAAFIIIVVAAVMAPAGRTLLDEASKRGAVLHAAGMTSRAEYLRNPRNSETRGYMAMVDRVNAVTDTADRILLLFEARGYRFRAETLPDNGLTNWPLLAPAVAEGSCLEGAGITHVLVGSGVLNYFRMRGLDPARIGWDHFPRFAERCLTLVDAGPGWLLMRARSINQTGTTASSSIDRAVAAATQ